jgi:biotin-(acetyl-CoA carboxylase) ligase
VCLPYEKIPVRMTLLPLQVAILVAERAEQLIAACSQCAEDADASSELVPDATTRQPQITLKWPNDVLIDDRKLSGTLIENETDALGQTWFLVGIGVNIAAAPSLQGSTGRSPRAATCLQEYCCCARQQAFKGSPDSSPVVEDLRDCVRSAQVQLPPTTAAAFGNDLAHALVDWAMDKTDKDRRERDIIDQWKSYAELGKQYEIRGRADADSGERGEIVTTLDIQSDGQLLVRGKDGKERLLIADYLY